MLTLKNETIDDDYKTQEYACDFLVTCTGDGLWGCEAGRVVRVTGVTVVEEDGYKNISVEHDSTWDVYTDRGFRKAVCAALGYAVSFTEQGMQEDGLASMET